MASFNSEKESRLMSKLHGGEGGGEAGIRYTGTPHVCVSSGVLRNRVGGIESVSIRH